MDNKILSLKFERSFYEKLRSHFKLKVLLSILNIILSMALHFLIKKFLYFRDFREMELSSSDIKKFLIFQETENPKCNFLILQETETLKKYIFYEVTLQARKNKKNPP